MATIRKIYVSDKGTDILIDMAANIAGATNIKFYVTKPTLADPNVNETIEWAAAIQGTKYFLFTSVADSFDIDGHYVIRPHFTLGSWTGSGNKVSIDVEAK